METSSRGEFVCCLMIVVIFMGLGGSHRLGRDFKVIIWERVILEEMGPFFMGEVTPQDTM